MAITTTSNITTPVNVVFQLDLLRNAKANCPYFTGTLPAEIMEHSGTFTAKWRRIENLAAQTTALAELSGSLAFPTRTSVTPSITDLTATVQKYGNFIFLTEEVDLGNYNGQAAKLVEILGINAGISLNQLQRNEMEDNSTQIFAGTATSRATLNAAPTASGEVSYSAISKAVNLLDRADALRFTPQTTGAVEINTTPIRSAYWGICHPDVEQDIRLLTGFTAVERYAIQTEVVPEEFGTVAGVRWVRTTVSSIHNGVGLASTGSATNSGRAATAGNTDGYSCVVYGMDAAGSVGFGFEHVKETYRAGDRVPGVQLLAHPRGSAGAADPLNEVGSMGWKSWHAAKVLNSNWIYDLNVVASNITAGLA